MPSKKLPQILTEYCIGCKHCILACPLGVLKIVKKVAKVVHPENCESEGRCIAACPQKAIPQLQEMAY